MINPIRTRYDPVLGKDVIVAGHQRWLAAELAGFELVPIIRSKVTIVAARYPRRAGGG